MPSFQSIYEKLLFLYPEQYRREYGAQIIQTTEDMLANEQSHAQKMGILAKEIILLPGNVLEQHIATTARRGGLTANTLMGFIALLLLLPFFVAMVSDEISERFYGYHLYGSWFWSMPILAMWAIALPLLSLFISLVTYSLLMLHASVRAGKAKFQIKKLWLVMVSALVSAGILFVAFFHSSAHCWLNTSGNDATRIDEVVRCVENDFLSSDKN